LTDAGIQPRVVNFHASLAADPRSGRTTLELGLVVRRQDEKSARAVIEEKTALPPEGEEDDPFAEMEGFLQVGYFNRDDALIVAQTLGEAGISFLWNDDRDERNATTDDVSIEVKGAKLSHAQKLAGARLGVTEDGVA
jgi:hypothetical protein